MSELLKKAVFGPLGAARYLLGSARWLTLAYLLAAGTVLLGVTLLWQGQEESIIAAIVAFIFPEEWSFAGEAVVGRIFDAQRESLMKTVGVTGSLLVVSLLLFPLKEALSARIERDHLPSPEPLSTNTLLREGWEEVKWFLLFVAVTAGLFQVGYHPGPVREFISVQGATLFLFITFAVDFISPTLFRHGLTYDRIFRLLARRPLMSLLFGATFAVGPLVVSHFVEGIEEIGAGELALLFGVEVVAILGATAGGTWLASRLLEEAQGTEAPALWVRGLFWVGTGVLLSFTWARLDALGGSVHRKSQVLKCEWDFAWRDASIERPTVASMLSGELSFELSLPVEIRNPTPLDIEVEANRIELRHEGRLVGETSLSPFEVPAGVVRDELLTLSVELDDETISSPLSLLSKEGWAVTLFLELDDGEEFPFYLLEP